MTIRLQDATPVAERLRPAATAVELLWFRKKRRAAVTRSVVMTGGMFLLYLAGSLLRASHRPDAMFTYIALGVLALTQVGLMLHAISSTDLVKEIQARRSAMYEDQRKRVFLTALDEDVPGG